MTKVEFLGIVNDIDENLINDYLVKCCSEGEAVKPFYSGYVAVPIWKRILPIAAAICAAFAVIFGGAKLLNLRLNQNSLVHSDTVTNPEVDKANEIAAKAKDDVDKFLLNAMFNGYGYNGKNKTASQISLMVENGEWSCQSNMYGFNSTGDVNWHGRAEGITAETDKTSIETAEEKLCMQFAKSDDYKDIKNANFAFLINKGKCTCSAYIGLSASELDGDYDIFNPNDFDGQFPESYKWSGGEAGIVKDKNSDKTIIVGTCPVVKMGDVEVTHKEENAQTYAYRNAKELYITINDYLKKAEQEGFGINKLDEPRSITIEVSYKRYSYTEDEELFVSMDKRGKFMLRLIHAIEDEYDYSSAWIKAYIVNGECKGIVFMTAAVGADSYPAYEDFQRGSYNWDSEEEVGSKSGITMGVYPELSYSSEELEKSVLSAAVSSITLFGKNLCLPYRARDLGEEFSIDDPSEWIVIDDVITSNLYYGDKKIGTVNLAADVENTDAARVISLCLGFGLSDKNIPDEETKKALYDSYGWYSDEIELDFLGLSFKSTEEEIIGALGTPDETTDAYFDDFMVYKYAEVEVWIKLDNGKITEFDIRLT